jgi:hypothetical protein
MLLYRVHAYDDEHYATLVIRAEGPEQASSIAVQFVTMMHLGCYPANHEREFPEVVRVSMPPRTSMPPSPSCLWSRALKRWTRPRLASAEAGAVDDQSATRSAYSLAKVRPSPSRVAASSNPAALRGNIDVFAIQLDHAPASAHERAIL